MKSGYDQNGGFGNAFMLFVTFVKYRELEVYPVSGSKSPVIAVAGVQLSGKLGGPEAIFPDAPGADIGNAALRRTNNFNTGKSTFGFNLSAGGLF